jgi:polar amino acid transport system permease protein
VTVHDALASLPLLDQLLVAQTANVPPNEWDWGFAIEILPRLLEGLWLTVRLTLVGSVVALSLGLVLALLRRAPLKVLSWPATFVIEFIRSTPVLIQLFFAFYALPAYGISLSPFATGIAVLGLHFACYASEAYRAGIDSVPKGQWEASVSINLSTTETWRRIVLPQAIPTVIPALGNYAVAMFKEAVLVSIIGLVDVVGVARQIGTQTFRGLEPFTLAGLLFLAVSIPAAIGVRYLEKRYVYERN